MFTNRDELEESLRDAGIDSKEAIILAQQARPAVLLKPQNVKDEDSVPPGVTKIGGRPDLPEGVDWPWRPAYPQDANGMEKLRREAKKSVDDWRFGSLSQRAEFCEEAKRRLHAAENRFPLSFIAQINFAEMWAAGDLDDAFPREGILSFFYDLSVQPWGYDPKENIGFAVLYHPSVDKLTRRAIPEQLPWLHDWNMGLIYTVEERWILSPLSYETQQWVASGLSDGAIDLVDEWGKDVGYYPGHQFSGWPDAIQGDMQVECALVSAGHYCGNGDAYNAPELAPVRATATEWLLLAQIDSDENDNGWMWGDCGRLYLWIKRSDLIARHFERVHLIQQCY